jgi:hypothetical protein
MDPYASKGHAFGAPLPIGGETNGEYRARIARHHAEKVELRQQELIEQASSLKTPTTRIRLWERIHQINLPQNPDHQLISVIARGTGLTVEEVRDEQRTRLAPPPAA